MNQSHEIPQAIVLSNNGAVLNYGVRTCINTDERGKDTTTYKYHSKNHPSKDIQMLTTVFNKLDREESRQIAKQIRDDSLQDSIYTLPDSSVYQVRPQDLVNFEVAISNGVDEEWVLADNSLRLTTVVELQEILSAGITQGKVIWNTYKQSLKNIGSA